MWAKLMDVENGYTAETWWELFNAEGLSIRVVPPLDKGSMMAAREIYVPDSKTHVAREIMRKI